MNEIVRDFTEKTIIPALPDLASGAALKAYTLRDEDKNPIGVMPIVADLEARIDDWKELGHTVNTKEGRDAIRSFAHVLTKAKTKVEAVGKELADEQKLVPRKIDEARNYLKTKIEALRDGVRLPLTEWETAEEARVKKHTDALSHINTLGMLCNARSEQYRAALDEVKAIEIGAACDEFLAEYAIAKEAAINALAAALATQEKREQDERDLARLRAAEEERQRKEQEEKLRKEGEEKAKLEAEADARAEKERVDRQLADERAAAEKRERELIEAKEAAERRATEAAAEERRKQAAEQERQAEEQRRREADVAHRTEVNRAALTAFVAGGIDEATAKIAITMIVMGQIPAISISY